MANTELGAQNKGLRLSRRSFLLGATGAGAAIVAEPALSNLSLVFAEGNPGQTIAAETPNQDPADLPSDIVSAAPEGQVITVPLPGVPSGQPEAELDPFHLPAVPAGYVGDPKLFAFQKPPYKPSSPQYRALEAYLTPFEAAQIGKTTDQELAGLLPPKTNVTKKGGYIIYDVPVPPATAQVLKSRFLDPNRANKLVTIDGKVFMKVVNGTAPMDGYRVDELDYSNMLSEQPIINYGHSYWGNDDNYYFPNNGVVLVTQPHTGLNGLIDEYIEYNPRKPDGSVLSPTEFRDIYDSLLGKELDNSANAPRK